MTQLKTTKSFVYFMLITLVFTLLISACTTQEEPIPVAEQIILTISGSGSTTAILEAVQADFEADNPNYQLEILRGSGSGGGVEGILADVLDIAAMARPAKDEEAAQGVQYTEFGQAGEGIIVHFDVSVTNLTTDQIKAIFSGEIDNWSDVGGQDLPILLYVRDERDSSTTALRSALIGDVPFSTEVAKVASSQSDMLESVANTPGSIGIATWPTALARGDKVKAVSVDGIAPDNEGYPMISPLGLGYLAAHQADAQILLDWLLSASGKNALQAYQVITP